MGQNGESLGGPISDEKKKKAVTPMATVSETLHFAFSCGVKIQFIFFFGLFNAVLNGLVYPILAYLFSTSFSDIGRASNDMAPLRKLAYTFMIVGVYALVTGMFQTWSFETVAHHSTQKFRLNWFKALLRQDPAFFDVNDIGGIAGQIGPSANKYRRGMGRKFGEGIQFLTTGVGGLGYALYVAWKVALVVLAVVPIVALSAVMVLQLNQTKGSRAAASYKTASGVAYSSVSAIKTVLSLNGIQEMIDKYAIATQEAYKSATGILLKQGFANGRFANFLKINFLGFLINFFFVQVRCWDLFCFFISF